jgi:hypothetical protein
MADQIVCVDNIGPGEVKKRLTLGIVTAVLTLVCTAALLGLGVDRFWRAMLFVPAWMAGLGFLQARQRT